MASSPARTDQRNDVTHVGSPRFRYFPVVWFLLVGTGWLWVQLGDFDVDKKSFAHVICGGLFWAGMSVWILRHSGLPQAARLVLGVGPWVAVAIFLALFEMVNDGDMRFRGFRYRWATARDRLLEVPDAETGTIQEWATTEGDYPGFLGTNYWAEISGVELASDWDTEAPQQMWRCPMGAGWSSFAIVGDFAVTQEQRGEQEMVVCYRISTANPQGEIVWTHSDQTRFDPSGPGALGYVGPRATPTIYQGRVLTMGATGILNCLDARTGNKLWAHDTLSRYKTENIMWGKANSPVILESPDKPPRVVVSVGAPEASIVVFDLETGDEVWAAGSRRSSYATPVVCELAGVQQIVSVNEDFVTAHAADDGRVLWEQPWPGNSDSNATASQPVPLAGDRVFLSKGYGIGASLLQLSRTAEGDFIVRPLWNPEVKLVMKTKLGNVVVRDGYVYGLDGGILECIELETGKRKWKKRRQPEIGHGQIMAVGGNLVVSTETGELLLVSLNPKRYEELASMRVFSDEEITWNNPAFSAPYLLMRNSVEAVCLKLPLEN